MNFYFDAIHESQDTLIRVHPILLSLTEVMNEPRNKPMTNPDIKTLSENDERVLTNRMYTPPSALPPLEIHILGRNGLSLLP